MTPQFKTARQRHRSCVIASRGLGLWWPSVAHLKTAGRYRRRIPRRPYQDTLIHPDPCPYLPIKSRSVFFKPFPHLRAISVSEHRQIRSSQRPPVFSNGNRHHLLPFYSEDVSPITLYPITLPEGTLRPKYLASVLRNPRPPDSPARHGIQNKPGQRRTEKKSNNSTNKTQKKL